MTPLRPIQSALSAIIGVLLLSPASAAIVANSLTGVSTTNQYSSGIGASLHLAQSNTVPYTYNDSLSINTANGITFTTQGAASLTHSADTASYQEINAYVAGYSQQYGGTGQQSSGGVAANTLDTAFTFTLDAPGTLTFSSTNTAVTVDLGDNSKMFTFKLDGQFVHASSLANVFYSIPLSAGDHTASLSVWIGTFVGYTQASTSNYGEVEATSRYKIQVESVPEASVSGIMAIGLLVLAKRRR